MKTHEQMDAIFLPTETGMIKIYAYGFSPSGSWGQVYTEYNDITITVKGYHRKKTIIRSLSRLNESLLNKMEDK
ncbi:MULTISPECIES: hypothetical protein [Heyndrickxia]|jgi:hypothetical protein|uniref:Uncharacterized protein n=1 Tax=Heyndrickxia oleronia TaxID=38875 RepID=A0A8E2I3V3_9BACI|nr:hypothetical protein [Heyndrickxia oleronia]NYV67344.1 hypothetical protein [Bacillus sp. Gen3]OJH17864.1 hypothetical protein BLX88_15160 [Bacillus obstructivus]MBU5214426.1 hypothetical protein [Heyndrickxia oleronia]MCI1589510.1 hypothetical protein [Heyndrickxia oleronia]MCI1611436.1 hypothetical protein [Heyndrickxia oleronia]